MRLLERYSGNLDDDGILDKLDKDFWNGWAQSGGVPGPVDYYDTYTPATATPYTSPSHSSTYAGAYSSIYSGPAFDGASISQLLEKGDAVTLTLPAVRACFGAAAPTK